MSIEVRKLSPSRQSQSVDGAKAIIEEHGYRVRVTIDLDYNRMTMRQVTPAHNRVKALLEHAINTAEMLRDTNPPLIEVDELNIPVEMDTEHA